MFHVHKSHIHTNEHTQLSMTEDTGATDNGTNFMLYFIQLNVTFGNRLSDTLSVIVKTNVCL